MASKMYASGTLWNGYFKVHMIILLMFGVCVVPLKNKYLKFLYSIYSFLFVGTEIYLYTILEALGLSALTDDIGKFTLNLSYSVTHVLGAAKTTIVLARRSRFIELITKLETGIFAPDIKRGGPKEAVLVKEAVNYGILQCCLFWMMVFPILGCRVVFVAVQGEIPFEVFDVKSNTTQTVYKRETPYPFWSPYFDISGTPYYELASSFQIMSYLAQGIHIGGIDAIICGCIMHMRSQFLIIKATLERILNEPFKEERKDLNALSDLPEKKEAEIRYKVVECVKHHQKILEFCEIIEDEFKYLMLLQFIASLLIICFGLFQLSVTAMDSFAFGSISLYIILMTGQIFMYCYVGHQVWDVSDQMSTYIFHCRWYMAGPSTKKALLLMMMRSQRPIKFTAGKFTFLVLQTFVTILRASFSYFMVLRQRNNLAEDH